MISSLKGRVSEVEKGIVVVEVGGVGLEVHVPTPFLEQLRRGESAQFYTHLVVRQDALSLYGFETPEGREFFIILVSVSGVGPRMALTMLSVLEPDTIRRAVFNEQEEVFRRVPGIGKKTAQKIVLFLQDRIPSVEGLEPMMAISDVDTEVLGALTSLGYSLVEAQAALQSIPRDTPQDVEVRLRLALQYFST